MILSKQLLKKKKTYLFLLKVTLAHGIKFKQYKRVYVKKEVSLYFSSVGSSAEQPLLRVSFVNFQNFHAYARWCNTNVAVYTYKHIYINS